MRKVLKTAVLATLFLPSSISLVLAHESHNHRDHNQHLVSIAQPDKIYKDGDPVVLEFSARKLLSGKDVGPYAGELKIFLSTKFHILSDTVGNDFTSNFTGDPCITNPSHIIVKFDEQGRSITNDRMEIYTISDTAGYGRINLDSGDVIYNDGKLSHIEVELLTGCYHDKDSYIVSAQKFANYLTENSLISKFNNSSKKTADKIEGSLETAFTDNDDRFNFDLSVSGDEKAALKANFAFKFNDVAVLWGSGDVVGLDGTIGFNLRTGQNSLIGLSGTMNNESLSLGNGEYNTEVTTINPFLFFKSEDWGSQLLLMTGHGTGEVNARSGRLNYYDSGEMYIGHFKGLTEVFGPFSIVGEGWYANHYLYKSNSSVITNNTRLSLQFALESIKSHLSAEYDYYSEFDTVIGSNVRFGIFSPYFEWNVLQERIKGGTSVQVNENLEFNVFANNVPIVNFGGNLNW